MNDYEPDFNYDQDDYIEDDIISQLNDTSILSFNSLSVNLE